MGFSQAAMTCKRPYGTISGCAARAELRWFIHLMLLVALVASTRRAMVFTLVCLALTFVLLIWPHKWGEDEAHGFGPPAAYVGTTK